MHSFRSAALVISETKNDSERTAGVPNQSEPTIEITWDGKAGAALIHSVIHAEPHIGIAGRHFEGRSVLRTRSDCRKQNHCCHQDHFSHCSLFQISPEFDPVSETYAAREGSSSDKERQGGGSAGCRTMSRRFALDELKGKDLQKGRRRSRTVCAAGVCGPYAVATIAGGKEPARMPALHVSKTMWRT